MGQHNIWCVCACILCGEVCWTLFIMFTVANFLMFKSSLQTLRCAN